MQATAVAYAASPPKSNRRIAVSVGILFFFQLISFMIGSSMIERYLDGGASRLALTTGVVLEMFSGVAVVAIGFLMFRVLREVNERVALGYPVMRLTEFAVSAALAIYLLTQLEPAPHRLMWVYIPTAIGGLILNYLFFMSRLVPRWISMLGFIGYSLLLLTVPLELSGVTDANTGPAFVLLAPGALYEFMILPIWLIAKGFQPPTSRTAHARPVPTGDPLEDHRGKA